MSLPDVKLTIPLLASASGAGNGLPYPLWRPQMQTFLMRAGIEKRDYEEEIARWEELSNAVETDARTEEQDAVELLLGSGGSASAVKKEPADEARAKAKKRVAEWVGRTRKAYGYLHAALPSDLRQLVAEVPQGYAFGVWSFLEKKFRNTEQDSVMALWKKFSALQQEQEESFDVYKARVDAVRELLVHAKQTPPPGLYASLLLWNLQPRYATAVLTLKTGDKLKDPAAVDWAYIVEYMAQYERTQRHTEGEAAGDSARRTMAVLAGTPQQQSRSPVGSSKKKTAQDLSKVDCYYCKKLGHYASDCPAVKEKERRQKEKVQRKNAFKAKNPKGAGERSRSQSPVSKEADDSSGSETEGRSGTRGTTPKAGGGASAGMRAVRVHNKYAALLATGPDLESESDSEEDCHIMSSDGDGLQVRRPARLQLASILRRPGGKSASTMKSVKFGQLGGTQPEPRREDCWRTLLRKAKAVDSGAQVNATGNKDLLVNLRHCAPMPLLMANQSIVVATLIGDMPLNLQSADERHPKACTEIVKDVYYHEKIEANLLSWDKMRRNGWELHSTKAGTDLVTPAGHRVKASTRGGLTLLEETKPSQVYAMRMGKVVCTTAEELMLLHQRTGHASWGRLLKMCKAGTTVGVGDISAMPASELEKAESRIKACTACTQGKQRKKAVGHEGLERGTEKGEVLHMDTFYVTRRDRHTGDKVREYGLLAVDSFTEVHWFTPSLRYRDVQDEAVTILRESHTLNGRHPRLVVSDLGKEFDNAVVRDYCSKHGIKYQPTPRGAKELNGLSEKHVGTVKDHTRTMLLASGVPNHIGWMRAATHHVYLWNRTHLCKATGLTPYETATGRKPSLLNVGVFGCDAFVHQDRDQRDDTFSPKAEPGVYLGHDWAQNCPVVRMVHSGKIVRAKDVVFRDGSFEHIRAEKEGRAEKIKSLSLDDVTGDTSELEPDGESDDAKSAESVADSEPDSNSEDESVAADSTKYTVKAITSHRTSADGSMEYQVKWVGYRATTWEPARIIQEDAPRVAQAYEQFLESRSKARVTRSQASRSAVTVTAAAQPEPASASAVAAAGSSAPSSGSSGEEKEEISDVVAARNDAAQRL